MKIEIPKDCGNAPKKEIIAELNIAWAKADVIAITDFFHPEIEWEMVDEHNTIKGISQVTLFLENMKAAPALALHLQTVITHGKYAAARGTLQFNDQEVRFHDFYEFSSAGSKKITKITSMAKAFQKQK